VSTPNSKLFDENGNYKLSNKHDKDMNLASAVEGAVVEHKAEVTLDIPDTLVVNGNSAEYNTLEESRVPLLESCSERNDLDLVEVLLAFSTSHVLAIDAISRNIAIDLWT
jgi:hypothetical protein